MQSPIGPKQISAEILELLEETFERSHGIYLYRRTSLFETIGDVSAEEASSPACTDGSSVAAQTAHVAFYLQVLQQHISNTSAGDADWEIVWRKVTVVSSDEWNAIRADLHETYRRTVALLLGLNEWDGENDLSGALAIVVHSAYHLGVIRQALWTIRNS